MSVTAQPAGVFHDPDVDEQEPDAGAPTLALAKSEFPVAETHGIALWPTNRLHADSRDWAGTTRTSPWLPRPRGRRRCLRSPTTASPIARIGRR